MSEFDEDSAILLYDYLNAQRYKYSLRPRGNPDLYLKGYTDAVKDAIDFMDSYFPFPEDDED